MDREVERLLLRAEQSLAELLSVQPTSKHQALLTLYKQIRSDGIKASELPSARDLFWDAPDSEMEENCLNDAFAVFSRLKQND